MPPGSVPTACTYPIFQTPECGVRVVLLVKSRVVPAIGTRFRARAHERFHHDIVPAICADTRAAAPKWNSTSGSDALLHTQPFGIGQGGECRPLSDLHNR